MLLASALSGLSWRTQIYRPEELRLGRLASAAQSPTFFFKKLIYFFSLKNLKFDLDLNIKEQRGYLENKPGPGLNILPNGNIFAAKVNRQKLTGKI